MSRTRTHRFDEVQPLLNALGVAALSYWNLAEAACDSRDVQTVYRSMKKYIETENEMRTLTRRYEV